MKTQDVIEALVELGAGDFKSIQSAISAMPAGDYVELVNAINHPNHLSAKNNAKNILGKYMSQIKEDSYLDAMFSKFKEGQGLASESELLGILKPIQESTAPDAKMLAREGFNYFMQLEDAQGSDSIMDWLDENQIEYMTDGNGQYHIKCGDRESAYKVSKAIGGLVSKKKIVRDSILDEAEYVFYGHDDQGQVSQSDTTIRHHEVVLLSISAQSEEEAREKALRITGIKDSDITRVVVREAKKTAGKREAEAKAKIANLKTRDLDLLALSQRGGKGAHESPESKSRKKDSFDRKAKHKTRPMEEQMEDQTNETASEVESAELTEGLLGGMAPVGALFRLRELAGMAPAPVVAPEDEDLSDITIDHDESGFVEPNTVDDMPVDVPAVDPIDGVDVDPMADLDPMADAGLPADMGNDMMADPMVDMGGVPGDLPPMGAEAPMALPTQSEAMSHIEDNLNEIQNKLAEIRLSEYKSLVLKLTNLTQQVQTMGRDYLGERRKK